MFRFHKLILVFCILQLFNAGAAPISENVSKENNTTDMPSVLRALESLSKDAKIDLIKENEEKIISVVRSLVERDKAKSTDRRNRKGSQDDKGKATAHMNYEIDMGQHEDEKVEKIKQMFGKINDYLVCTYEENADCDSKFLHSKNETNIKNKRKIISLDERYNNKIKPKNIELAHDYPKSLHDEPLTGVVRNWNEEKYDQPINMFPPRNRNFMHNVQAADSRTAFLHQKAPGHPVFSQWHGEQNYPIGFHMPPLYGPFQRWPAPPRHVGKRINDPRQTRRKHIHYQNSYGRNLLLPFGYKFRKSAEPITGADNDRFDGANRKSRAEDSFLFRNGVESEKNLLDQMEMNNFDIATFRPKTDKAKHELTHRDVSAVSHNEWPEKRTDKAGKHQYIDRKNSDVDGFQSEKNNFKLLNSGSNFDENLHRFSKYDVDVANDKFRSFKVERLMIPMDRKKDIGEKDSKFGKFDEESLFNKYHERSDKNHWKWNNDESQLADRSIIRNEHDSNAPSFKIRNFDAEKFKLFDVKNHFADSDIRPIFDKKPSENVEDSLKFSRSAANKNDNEIVLKNPEQINSIDDAWEALEMGLNKQEKPKFHQTLRTRPLEWPSRSHAED